MDKLGSLGIDLQSMVFYLINTGILVAVLIYLAYKPIMKFVNERQKQITGSIDESKRLQKAFEEQLAEAKKEKEQAEAELRAELDNLQKFTEQKRAELVAEMEKERNNMLEKAKLEITKEKERILSDAEAQTKTIISKIVLEIVENKVPENVIQESIESAWEKVTY